MRKVETMSLEQALAAYEKNQISYKEWVTFAHLWQTTANPKATRACWSK